MAGDAQLVQGAGVEEFAGGDDDHAVRLLRHRKELSLQQQARREPHEQVLWRTEIFDLHEGHLELGGEEAQELVLGDAVRLAQGVVQRLALGGELLYPRDGFLVEQTFPEHGGKQSLHGFVLPYGFVLPSC